MKKHTTIICKRIISLVLVFVLTVSLLPSAILSVSAAENFTDFSGGDGSESSPFIIANLSDFKNVYKFAIGKYNFKLVNDVNFGKGDYWDCITDFDGVFDGNGYEIKNFGYDLGGEKSTVNEPMIKNLSGTVKELTISGSPKAYSFICSFNYGSIIGCTTNGYLVGSGLFANIAVYNYGDVINCTNNAYGSSSAYGAGLVVNNYGNVSYCVNTRYVYTDQEAGGIVAYNYKNVSNCINLGDIASPFGENAGIVTVNKGVVTNCINTGRTTSHEYVNGSQSGGIVSLNEGKVSNCFHASAVDTDWSTSPSYFCASNQGTITNCYSACEPRTKYYYPYRFGGSNSGKIENCYYLIPEKATESTETKGFYRGEDTTIGLTEEEMKKAISFKNFDFDSIWTIDTESDYIFPQLKSIQIKSLGILELPSTTSIVQGQPYEIEDGKLKVEYINDYDNTPKVAAIGLSDLPYFCNTKLLGDILVRVCYACNDIYFNLTVKEKLVKSMTCSKLKKTTYNLGEELDISDLNLHVIYRDSDSYSETIKVTNDMVSGFDPYKVGSQNVVITYLNEQVTITVKVLGNAKSLSIKQKPKKLEYRKGEPLDFSDGLLLVNYKDGTTKTIGMDEADVFYNRTLMGNVTVRLEYEGINTFIDIVVSDKQITSIVVGETPDKLEYVLGQPLNLTGGTIIIFYNNNTYEIAKMNKAISHYDKTKTGDVSVKLSYESFYTYFQIKVNEKSVTKMTLNAPEKLECFYGESLDLSDVSLDVHYVSDDNYSEKVKVTNEMISDYDPNNHGVQNVTVTYLGESATFTVIVIRKMVSISVKNMPDKLVYIKGAPLDLTGGLLNVNYSDGFTTTINMSDAKPYYNQNIMGDVTVSLEYEGLSAFFQIVVNEKQITSILVEKEPDKLEYVQGQPLDLNGGIIKIFYNDDTIETVEMKEAKPYYNRNLTGDITVRLNYKDIDTYLQIKVNKKAVAKMSFSIPEKTEYKVGEELDLSGLSLDVIYKSKDNYGEKITVTPDMVSGYDSKKVGIQSVIVKYLNVKVEFEVEVVPIIGDIDDNGVVDIKDATMLQRYFAEISTLSAQSIAVADVNNDRDLTISDVTAIQLMIMN